MRIAPITKEDILRLVAATLVPLVPLLLTMMPLEELLGKVVAIFALRALCLVLQHHPTAGAIHNACTPTVTQLHLTAATSPWFGTPS